MLNSLFRGINSFLNWFRVEYRVVEFKEVLGVEVKFRMSYNFYRKEIYYLRYEIREKEFVCFFKYKKVLKACEELRKNYKIAFDNGTTLTMFLDNQPSYTVEEGQIIYNNYSTLDRKICHKHYSKYLNKFLEEMSILYPSLNLKT